MSFSNILLTPIAPESLPPWPASIIITFVSKELFLKSIKVWKTKLSLSSLQTMRSSSLKEFIGFVKVKYNLVFSQVRLLDFSSYNSGEVDSINFDWI